MGAPLHLLQPYGLPRHPPLRISQPHFAPNTDDLFATVFGPADGSGVGLDPEFDFLAPPLTFDWPQFAPTTQAGSGSTQHGHAAGDSSPASWLDSCPVPRPTLHTAHGLARDPAEMSAVPAKTVHVAQLAGVGSAVALENSPLY